MMPATIKTGLQKWYDAWLEEMKNTNLIYVAKNERGEPSSHQVHFVRDTLSRGVVWSGVDYDDLPDGDPPRTDCKNTAWVIGEHHSKSVRLPVFLIERPDLGIQFVLRNNFHDWNVSVVSEMPITTDLRGFQLDFDESDKKRGKAADFKPGDHWGYCFFQGFPDAYKFGPHALNPRRFSICIGSEYSLYTFVWLIMRDIRARGPQ